MASERRRFPPPWSVEERPACYIVKDASGFALAYVYYEEEAGRRNAAKLMTQDKARRIAATVSPTFNQLLGVNNSNVAVGFYTDAGGVSHGYTYTIAGGTFSANINDPHAGTALGQGTTAAAINNSGELAGFYVDAAGVTHGFTDINGTFTTIDPTGSTFTQLLGISDNGLADGDFMDAAANMHGFLFDLNNDTFQTLDDPFGIGTTTLNGITISINLLDSTSQTVIPSGCLRIRL